jgi:hypothetical protein
MHSLKTIYKYLVDIKIKLNELNILEDLNIDNLKKSEIWKLDVIKRIGEKKNIIDDNDRESGIKILKVANIKILMFVSRIEDEEKLSNFYTPCISLRAVDKTDSSKITNMSQYVLLKKNDLSVSNFNGDIVYEDIIKFPPEEYYLNQVNLFLLEVIKAFELNEYKTEELYLLSYKISKWLVDKSDTVHYYMNFLQVIKRRKGLPQEDIYELKKILPMYRHHWEIYTGLLILLDLKREALDLLSNQSIEDQQRFQDYPIYYFLI